MIFKDLKKNVSISNNQKQQQQTQTTTNFQRVSNKLFLMWDIEQHEAGILKKQSLQPLARLLT